MTTETSVVKADAPPAPLTIGPPPTALMTTRDELAQMWAVAQTVSKAKGMVPAAITTPEQAMAVMLAGWELGLRPMTALRHVYIVNGKTDIETRAMVGIIRARDPRIQFSWPEYTKEAVTCEIARPGQPVTRVKYTVADAKASGQYEGKMGIWKSYTRDMLYAAATKRACRLGCPDLINAIEGSMTTVSDAEMAIAPVQSRVLDNPPAPDLPSDLYDAGDDGPLSPEVEAPDPTIYKQRVIDLTKRAKAETDADGFALLRSALAAKFPKLVSEAGALTLSGASGEELVAIGDFIATSLDGRAPAEVADGQASLV